VSTKAERDSVRNALDAYARYVKLGLESRGIFRPEDHAVVTLWREVAEPTGRKILLQVGRSEDGEYGYWAANEDSDVATAFRHGYAILHLKAPLPYCPAAWDGAGRVRGRTGFRGTAIGFKGIDGQDHIHTFKELPPTSPFRPTQKDTDGYLVVAEAPGAAVRSGISVRIPVKGRGHALASGWARRWLRERLELLHAVPLPMLQPSGATDFSQP